MTWKDQPLGLDKELSISLCNYFKFSNKRILKGFGEVDGLCLSDRGRKKDSKYAEGVVPFRQSSGSSFNN